MELLQYEKEYRIPVYEIGADGMLSIHSLFNFLQDIASEHATRLNFGRDDLMKDNHFWVLSRIYAKIENLPEWEETIMVRTWPKGVDKLFAIRDFELLYPGGQQLVSATSSWLVVDRTTKRVQRPYNLLSRFNSETTVRSATGRAAAKIEALAAEGKSGELFRVKTSDLDINLHANNAMYVKWVTDEYDLDFRKCHTPVSVEINFIAEAKWNDLVFIKTSPEDIYNKTFRHSVIRSIDQAELCRVRIEWKDCSH